MAIVTGPLLSFSAKGMYAGTIVYRNYISGHGRPGRANIKGFTKKTINADQIKKQTAVAAAQKVFQSLNFGEKMSWENVAFGREDRHGNHGWEPDLAYYHKFMSYGIRSYLADMPIKRTITPILVGFGKDRFGLDPFVHKI